MVDEIEELGIRPLKVFEDEHDRAALRDAFDEPSPGREQVLARGGDPILEPKELSQPPLDHAAPRCRRRIA